MRMTEPCASRTTWRRKAGATAMAAALLVGSLPGRDAVAQTAAGAARFRGEPVTLNFVNADIEGVARAMSAILRQQFVVDPRVRGTITLYSEQPLTPREAYFNFLAALRGLGFTVVEVNGLFKIVPEADAKLQTGTVAIGDAGRRGDQILTQIYRLNHENANNLVPVLRPLISPNNTINANPGNNTLVVTDYADNLQRIGKIIAAMDVPATGDVEVIPLRYAVASDVAPLVQRLTEGTPGSPSVSTGGGAGTLAAPAILIDTRSNSLIVRSQNPARMSSLRALIAKLDLPAARLGDERQHLGRPSEERGLDQARHGASRRLRRGGRQRRRAAAAAGWRRDTRRPALGVNPAGTAGPPTTASRRRPRRRSRLRRGRRPAASSRPIPPPTR